MATTESHGAERPPGPSGLPLLGNTVQFARDRLGFVTRTAREYGDVVTLDLGGETVYHVHHPDYVRHVLVENNENYVKGRFFQHQFDFLGSGLLTSEGERWRRQRHLLEPAFGPDRIEEYASMMTAYTERMLDSWADGRTRDVHEEMMRLTLEIVAKALFDVDIREKADEVGTALDAVMAHFRRATALPVSVPEWVPTPDNVGYLRALSALDAIVDEIIREHRESDEDAGDVVSVLLRTEDETGERLSDEAIRDQVLTLLLAGHETTAQTLTFTWHLLARHPQVEARLLEEFRAVLGGRPPRMADVTELSHTERVVKESLRLYPPVYGVVRETIAADQIGGYRIPPGTGVGMFQWVVHRDPRFYEDPNAFVPERWTKGFQANRHPLAYFPFGGGPRRCIGERFALLEAQIVLATVAQQYHLELVSNPRLQLAPAITLRPKHGVEMVLHAR